MKRLYLIFVLIVSLAMPSCSGIGDGALIGDFSLSEQSGLIIDELPVSDGSYYTLAVSIYDSQGEKTSECYLEKSDVDELWKLLLHGEYQKDIDRTAILHPYVELQFFHMDKDGNLKNTPQDTGMYAGVHRIYSDDYVIQRDTSSGTIIKGHLEDAYQKVLDMYIGALQHVTEDEKAAGYKLNSLGILGSGAQVPTITDFSDIGCIFVEEYYTSETAPGEIAYNLFLYFESCSPEELEEKIAILEAREGISAAAKISVKTYDNPAYD